MAVQHITPVPYRTVVGGLLGGVDPAKVDRNFEVVSQQLVPTGLLAPWAGQNALAVPHGWLLCDGSVVLRDAYSSLFKVIGTEFNTGGETASQFRLPNMSDRFPRGTHLGSEVGDLGGTSAATMPNHSHGGATLPDGAFVVGHNIHGNNFNTGGISANHTHVSGGCHGHNVNAVVFSSNNATHAHNGGCGQVAESPGTGAVTGWGCTGTVDCQNTPATAGVSNDHVHNANHGHGADNHSVGSHQHLISAEGSGDNNPPYVDFRFIIKT